MNTFYEKLLQCAEAVNQKTRFQPHIGLTLGSGLGDYAESMQIKEVLEYGDIKGFPVSTVSGHKGRFLFGYVEGVPVVAMQGRVHYYEGYSMQDVVLPIRLMGKMGVKKIILTNAAGGVNYDFRPGDLMVITDHISSLVPSPLLGPNEDSVGVRFPDMSQIYSRRLRETILTAAGNTGVPVREGVYMQFSGPAYETPAEIRMCRALGGDAAGMSTACEAIAAHHMGLEVCGVSCITNMAAGMSDRPLNHAEVQETADKTAVAFKRLITESIRLMGSLS